MGFLDRWIREWIGSAAKPVEKRAFTLNWIKPQDRRGEEAREGGRSGNHSTGRAVEKSCQGQRRAEGECKKKAKKTIPVQGEGGLSGGSSVRPRASPSWAVMTPPPTTKGGKGGSEGMPLGLSHHTALAGIGG